MNPRATRFKDPVTSVDEVMNARMIAYPFTKLGVLPGDRWGRRVDSYQRGTGQEIFPQKPVYIIGTGESTETPMISQMEDMTTSKRLPGLRQPRLLRKPASATPTWIM